VSGGLDLDLDNIHVKEIPTIKLETAVTQLPRIRVELGLQPKRIHLPFHTEFGISVLGLRLLCFDVCGEGMVVIEEYERHEAEACA
jgi:hypothetical protein